MRTVPVNQSAGPLVEGWLPTFLISMGGDPSSPRLHSRYLESWRKMSCKGKSQNAPARGVCHAVDRRLALHGQDNTELGLAAHHSGISFSRFVERVGFNHRPH